MMDEPSDIPRLIDEIKPLLDDPMTLGVAIIYEGETGTVHDRGKTRPAKLPARGPTRSSCFKIPLARRPLTAPVGSEGPNKKATTEPFSAADPW